MTAEPAAPEVAAATSAATGLRVAPPGGPPAVRRPAPPMLPPAPSDGPPGVPEFVSSYLELLPGLYRDDPFLGRFLLIFEHVLGPIERTVDNIPWYFDPGVAPRRFLPWLAEWVGLVVDERWPEERRRDVIAGAAELYRWRGTRRGLREFLRLYLGVEPEIIEPSARDVAADRTRAFRFTVRVTLPRGRAIDRTLIEDIINFEKPAWAGYTLEIATG